MQRLRKEAEETRMKLHVEGYITISQVEYDYLWDQYCVKNGIEHPEIDDEQVWYAEEDFIWELADQLTSQMDITNVEER